MKKDFPLLKKEKRLVYLDNAATTHKPQVVIDAISSYYETQNANPHAGLYNLSVQADLLLQESRARVAKFLNASTNEIIFTKSATEGINQIVTMLGDDLGRWETVITTELEHHANFVPWQQVCKRQKAKLIVAKYDKKTGKLEDIAALVDGKTAIVAFTAMSNVTGDMLDVKNIAQAVRKKNPKALLVVDASQLIPHQSIDVREWDVDMVVFSGHKMYGPLGVGVLWIKESLHEQLRPALFGGNMISKVTSDESIWADAPAKFEAGTANLPGIKGLVAAITYIERIGYTAIQAHEEELKNYALRELKNIPHLIIFGHQDTRSGPVISFHVMDVHPHDVAQIAAQENVCVRAGHHCAQVLMNALDMPATVRISLGMYNSKQDIDMLIKAILKARKIINP